MEIRKSEIKTERDDDENRPSLAECCKCQRGVSKGRDDIM